jgi:DNA-binding transcriptional LysR family regulator
MSRYGCMELRHLRYFAEVAKYLSFSRAAESLHVSQPTMSRQIQELSDEIGTPVFERSGNRTKLTKAGEYFKIEVDYILERLSAAMGTARSLGEKGERTIRIGCADFFVEPVVLPLLEEYRKFHADTRIEILAMSSESQVKALHSGAIDIAFVRKLADHENFHDLFSENLALIFPARIYAGGDAKKCFERLAGHHFVSLSEAASPGLVELLLSTCGKYGFCPEIRLESSDAHSIIALVAAGLGWSIVPKMCLHEAPANGIGSIDLSQTVNVGICHRDGVSEECLRFIELTKAHFRDYADDRLSLSKPETKNTVI